jgi:hypothetical protein
MSRTNEVMTRPQDGEINAIICAMRLFPDSQKLQEHACEALRNFMLSTDNADSIRTNASELRQLMTHAARTFPKNALSVQTKYWLGCNALGLITNEYLYG